MEKYRSNLLNYLFSYKIPVGIVVYELGAVLLYELTKTDFRIPCVWRAIIGTKCMGCGLSEAMGKFIKLQFTSAYRANPLIYPFVIFGFTYLAKHFLSFTNQYKTT